MKLVAFNLLLDYSAKTWSPIVLPEIVMMEIGRLFDTEVRKAFSQFENSFNELQKLIREDSLNHLSIPDFTSVRLEYEEYLRTKLHRFYFTEIPSKSDILPAFCSVGKMTLSPSKQGRMLSEIPLSGSLFLT
ncbi:hypothetical protein [Dyadobacter chenhuakuii]|uniref:Uncharacterized protein n=1 Tax=Dyadobacter chenhuakuii TaxID=2909339 RepID=A0ABY4XLT2_9BACT|nr:hypothetical protein [Dyadobacter chenhuakuii]USJ31387.1 hypothetical protein NFI80_01330 [Dyadobacter chenhuakuii]